MTVLVESQDSLLCCRYALVDFKALAVQVGASGASSRQRLLYAIGVLADGDFEALGVWPATGAEAKVWQAALGDLKRRGVESIRFIRSDELAADRSILRLTYPSATLLPSCASRSPRATALSAVAVRALQDRVSPAIRRHGRFIDLRRAAAFVMGALRRAERERDDAGPLPRSATRLTPQAGPATRASVLPS